MRVKEIKVLNILVGLNLAKVAREKNINPSDLSAAVTGRRLDLHEYRQAYEEALIEHIRKHLFDDEFRRSALERRAS